MKEFLLCNKEQLLGQGENAVQNGRAKIATLETYHLNVSFWESWTTAAMMSPIPNTPADPQCEAFRRQVGSVRHCGIHYYQSDFGNNLNSGISRLVRC